MKEDEICVVFMNPTDAEKMIKEDPNVIDALVITKLIPDGEAIVIPRDEFVSWLCEERER